MRGLMIADASQLLWEWEGGKIGSNLTQNHKAAL